MAELGSADSRKRATGFLKTHLAVQVAAKVSGSNALYLRRPLRSERLEADKLRQIWIFLNRLLVSVLAKRGHMTLLKNEQIQEDQHV